MEQEQKTRQHLVLGREVSVLRERIDDRFLSLYLYFDVIDRLLTVSGSDIQFFLVWIALYLRREDGIINMPNDKREAICKIFRFTKDMYYRRLHNLIEADIVERLGVNNYKVDPGIVSVLRPVRKGSPRLIADEI